MKIIVVGYKGMLGTVLFEKLVAQGNVVVGLDLPETDITDDVAFTKTLLEHRPEFVFNCAAFTNVDLCETELQKAFEVNAQAVKTMAVAAHELGVPLLHISTDYVFSGVSNKPYEPEDKVCPVSAYGASKADGERFLIESHDKYYIIRTAWLYGHKGKNFVETIVKAAQEKGALKVVNDQKGAPTFVDDLVDFALLFLANPPFGIYHYTNAGETTWYDFAKQFLAILKITVQLSPCTTAEYPRPAHRPAYSVLSLEKTKQVFKINIPTWQDGLIRYLKARK